MIMRHSHNLLSICISHRYIINQKFINMYFTKTSQKEKKGSPTCQWYQIYSLCPEIYFLDRLRTLAKDLCTLISFPFLEGISWIWQLSFACTNDQLPHQEAVFPCFCRMLFFLGQILNLIKLFILGRREYYLVYKVTQ